MIKIYLNYEKYKTMGGKLELAAFNRLEFKTEKQINRRTFDRLKNSTTVSENVEKLTFELIELQSAVDGGQVTSTSNDGVSESYKVIDVDTETNKLIAIYLADEVDNYGTSILYRGQNL